MSSQGARWGLRMTQNISAAEKPVNLLSKPTDQVNNLTSEYLDRQESQLVHHYDNLQRTFNNWLRMMSELPFRMSVNLSRKEVDAILTERLYQQLDLRNSFCETPSPDWDQERLKAFFLSYKLCNKSLSQDSISKQTIGLKKYKNCVYFGGMASGRKEG